MSPKPYYEDDSCVIYHGDCREILPELTFREADGCVLALTDPPYGIADKWANAPMVGRNGSSRLWGKGEQWDIQPAPIESLDLVLEHSTHAIIWGGNYFALRPRRCWLVWDKGQSFSGSEAELAWTSFDGPLRVFRMSRIDAYVNKAEHRKSHPTEKPVQLMRWCIDEGLDTVPGVILDPFMGSGTTLRAAKDLGRKAIGIEIEERYCEIAAKRLAQEVLDLGSAA